MPLRPAPPESYLFVRTSFDTGALIRYQQMLEAFIRDLPESAADWVNPSSPDGSAMVRVHDLVLHSRLPVVLRSNTILAAWSLYESTILEIADYVRRTLSLQELTLDRGFDRSTRRYYRSVLGFEREPDAAVLRELQFLNRLRNAMMHGGGRKAAIPEAKWNELLSDAAARTDFDMETGVIVPHRGLAESMARLVATSLDSLVPRMRARLAGHM